MVIEKQPFFSVIIPTYNREYFIQKALDSVLKQSFGDFEVIVVDDGSQDQTEQLIKEFQDLRIIYLKQENHGVAHARNRGLERARGSFIAFLDSDDWWNKHKLEVFRNTIHQFLDIKIFHSEEIWYRFGVRLNPKKEHRKPTGFVFEKALPVCCISISTAVIHKDVFETVGTFDETLKACEDYDFWLRATHEFEVKLIPRNLTLKEGGRTDQLSSQWGLDEYRIKALAKMLSLGNLTQEEFEKTFEELQKKANIFIQGAKKRDKWNEARYYQKLVEYYKNKNLNYV